MAGVLTMEDLNRIFVVMAGGSFQTLATIAGIVVACVIWARAPRAAMLLMIASVLQLLLQMASIWFYSIYLPGLNATHETGVYILANVSLISMFGFGLLHALVYGLLIWAVATGRSSSARPL
jgi:hypothetical protein